MFERFTERARQVVVFAQDEARRLGQPHIGTEHILLGLLREEEGIAARVLGRLGVTLDEVRAEIVADAGRSESPSTGQIPFTPAAKRTLELALREAVSLGHHHIGTEHVLLGLARTDDEDLARILRSFDVDAERLRTEVVGALSGEHRLEHAVAEPDEIELTSPPLAPEVLAELERLAGEKQAALDRQSFAEAAAVRDAERRLRLAATRLVREWQRNPRDADGC